MKALLTFGAVAPITNSELDQRFLRQEDWAEPARLPWFVAAANSDTAERSMGSIECMQKDDARGLQGKAWKHVLRESKQGS